MSDFDAKGQRRLEMGVYVTRATTGKKEGVVAEEQLELYGWGLDPLAALNAYRTALGIPDDVDIRVCTDEESHYPSYTFDFQAHIQTTSTRPQRVLRELAEYFMNLANGIDTNPPFKGRYELNRLDDTRQEN